MDELYEVLMEILKALYPVIELILDWLQELL
jgi:hypothetical protein